MSKIQWHKVTWYSKLIALILFVALPFIGFYYGMLYGSTTQLSNDVANGRVALTANTAEPNYYKDPSTWQTESRPDGGFSIAYPIDFDTNGATQGEFFSLEIPKSFEPQTNFADAKLSVRIDANATQCDSSNNLEGGLMGATSTVTIAGISFTAFHTNDAGAGNLYDTTTYRGVHAGRCYDISYTMHSSQLGNYPPQYQLQQFDPTKITDLLERIIGTFKFL